MRIRDSIAERLEACGLYRRAASRWIEVSAILSLILIHLAPLMLSRYLMVFRHVSRNTMVKPAGSTVGRHPDGLR
jgi:hypothetical protein